MSFYESFQGVGSWDLQLHAGTPPSILNRFRYDADTGDRGAFGTLIVTPTWCPIESLTSSAALDLSIFSGVYVGRSNTGTKLRGFGLPYLLGGGDGGLTDVLDAAGTPDKNPQDWIDDHVLPTNGIVAGTVTSDATLYEIAIEAGMTRLAILNEVARRSGTEWRCNHDRTLDLDDRANLFETVPTLVLDALTGGRDPSIDGLFAIFGDENDWEDYTTRWIVEGKTGGTGDDTIVTPFYDLGGNLIERERYTVSSRTTDVDAGDLAAALLGRYSSPIGRRKFTVSVPDVHDLRAHLKPGDFAYVNHPDLDLFDDSAQIPYRGSVIFPPAVRVLGMRQPAREGFGYIFRDSNSAGELIDITEFVVGESGAGTLEVGGLRRIARVF